MAAHTNVTCCKSEIAVRRFKRNLNNCSSQQSMTSKRLLIKCPNLTFHCVVWLFFFLLISIRAEWIIHGELVCNSLQSCPLPPSTMPEAAPTIRLTFSCSSFHNAGSSRVENQSMSRYHFKVFLLRPLLLPQCRFPELKTRAISCKVTMPGAYCSW